MPKGDGLTSDDPLYLAMKAIIWSSEGKQAALDPTKADLPALSGVDLLLQKKLPTEYRRIEPVDSGMQLPLVLGSEVAIMMRELGYTETRRGTCPPECVAKSGMKWKPKA